LLVLAMVIKLEGIMPPIPTPFTSTGDFDEGKFRNLIKWYINIGVHGIAICGSTGEGYAILPDEYVRICEVAVSEVKGRVPVIAGIIVNSLKQALVYGEVAKSKGVDALMVTPPHYIFIPNEEGLYQYFKTIAETLNMPLIIYNVVPHVPVPLNVVLRLTNTVKQLVGIKQSRGDISGLADLVKAVGDKVSIMSAIDDLLYPSFILGAKGSIAGICTAAPDLSIDLYYAVKRGDHMEALEIHGKLLAIWRAIGQQDMPARVKALLELRGIPAGYPRKPILPLSESVREELRKVLINTGILK